MLTAIVTGADTVSYQWYADDVAINGETKSTFEVTKDYIGKTIAVEVTSGNETVKSAASDAVEAQDFGLTDVTQVTAKSIKLTFDKDASEDITPADIVIDSVDGTRHVPVLKLDFSEDGLTADATLTVALEDQVVYNVACGDSEILLVASVGEVASVVVSTITAPVNTRTKVEFSLFNAQGIDITDSVAINSTCRVDIDGDATLESSTANNSWITMTEVGDTATVVVTYNNNEPGFEDVVGKATVTCVDAEAVYGEPIYLNTGSTNLKSGCAKFYKSQTPVTTAVTLAKDTDLFSDYGTLVYFCALDDNGDPIDYTNYTVESSDPDIMSVEITGETSGRFCSVNVAEADVGSANLVITTTYNNKESYYTIPVVVTEVGKLATLSVSADRTSMTNAIDSYYFGTLTVSAKDSNGKELDEGDDYNYTVEIVDADKKAGTAAIEPWIEKYGSEGLVAAATGFGMSELLGGTEYYWAPGASGGSRTIKVTASDGTVELTKSVNINVKAITKNAWNIYGSTGTALTYAIELGSNSIKETGGTFAQLIAKAGSDFVGYVRQNADGATTIGNAIASDAVAGVKAKATLAGGTVFTATEMDADLNGYKFVIQKEDTAHAATAASADLKAFTVTSGTKGDENVLAGVELQEGADPAVATPAAAVLTKAGNPAKYTITFTRGYAEGNVVSWTADSLETALKGTTTAITNDANATAIIAAIKNVTVAAVAEKTDADTETGTFVDGTDYVPAKIAGSVVYEESGKKFDATKPVGDDNFRGTYTFTYPDPAGEKKYADAAAANKAWLSDPDGKNSGFEITAWMAAEGDKGYSGGGVTPVGNSGAVKADAKTTIRDVKAGVKKGTKYSVTGKLYNNKTNFTADIDNLADLHTLKGSSTNVLTGATTEVGNMLSIDADDDAFENPYYVVGNTSFDEVFAQPGKYTVQFTYKDSNKKTQKPTMNLTVTSSIWTPSVTVLNTTPESLTESDILAVLKADVDMNNNTSFHESIVGGMYSKLEWTDVAGVMTLVQTPAETNASGQFTTKYMGVTEDEIMFYVPVAKTFKAAS